MKITATKILARELQPGDLFSTAGQRYWDEFRNLVAKAESTGHMPVGEKVYIRTEHPCPADQAEVEVFRITIGKESA